MTRDPTNPPGSSSSLSERTGTAARLQSDVWRGVMALVLVLAFAACAPKMPAPNMGEETGYERLAATAAGESAFENAPSPVPAQLLPPALLQSDHHTVRGARWHEGFIVTYAVESDFGDFEVQSAGLLRKRIHELAVLGALQKHEVRNEKVYALAVANTAEGPIEGASQFLLHPLRTTSDIPKGMWSYAKAVVEMTQRQRTYLEDHYAEELMGFSKAKREWAYRLGVDVYSSNPILQQALDRYGWLSFAGGLTVRIPLMAVPGAASIALTVTTTGDDMKRELRDRAPEDIRIGSRRKLRAMNVSEPLVNRFLQHRWYSPSRQLWLVRALGDLEKAAHRGRFIAAASLADEPLETHIFTRMALILARYDALVGGIEEIMAPNGLLMAYTADKDMILPLYVDSGFWTESMAEFADEAQAVLPRDREIRRKIVLVSGRLSARTRLEYQARGWTCIEELEMTWLAKHDERHSRPGEPDADRIIPEIGG